MASLPLSRLFLLWQQCQNFLFEVGDRDDPPAKVRGGVGVHAEVGHLALLDPMSGGWIQRVIEVGPHRLQEDHIAFALRQAGRAFIERVLARHHDRLGQRDGPVLGGRECRLPASVFPNLLELHRRNAQRTVVHALTLLIHPFIRLLRHEAGNLAYRHLRDDIGLRDLLVETQGNEEAQSDLAEQEGGEDGEFH